MLHLPVLLVVTLCFKVHSTTTLINVLYLRCFALLPWLRA
jgi:hypothetical protein